MLPAARGSCIVTGGVMQVRMPETRAAAVGAHRGIAADSSRWVVTIGLFLSVGGAHTIVVAPKPPERVATEKIPIDVGLHLTDELKNYRVSGFRMGDKWNYENLGRASTTQFTVGLGQVFRTVEIVDARPPFAKPKPRTFHAVIEPAIDRFEFDIPLTKLQVFPARIQYRITVYDLSGKLLFARSVEGIGDTKGGADGHDLSVNPVKSAAKAIEDGARKALELLSTSEEIKGLLKP
jgi:hypothetical protein